MSTQYDRIKPYNQLPPLPPADEINSNPQILKALVASSRALAKVDGHLHRLPNPLMLINTLALQEAKSSTEIENIFTTEDALYKAISSKKKLPKISPETKEVLRYREALWAGYLHLKDNNIIETSLMLNIFKAIKNSFFTLGY